MNERATSLASCARYAARSLLREGIAKVNVTEAADNALEMRITVTYTAAILVGPNADLAESCHDATACVRAAIDTLRKATG